MVSRYLASSGTCGRQEFKLSIIETKSGPHTKYVKVVVLPLVIQAKFILEEGAEAYCVPSEVRFFCHLFIWSELFSSVPLDRKCDKLPGATHHPPRVLSSGGYGVVAIVPM